MLGAHIPTHAQVCFASLVPSLPFCPLEGVVSGDKTQAISRRREMGLL